MKFYKENAWYGGSDYYTEYCVKIGNIGFVLFSVKRKNGGK